MDPLREPREGEHREENQPQGKCVMKGGWSYLWQLNQAGERGEERGIWGGIKSNVSGEDERREGTWLISLGERTK